MPPPLSLISLFCNLKNAQNPEAPGLVWTPCGFMGCWSNSHPGSQSVFCFFSSFELLYFLWPRKFQLIFIDFPCLGANRLYFTNQQKTFNVARYQCVTPKTAIPNNHVPSWRLPNLVWRQWWIAGDCCLVSSVCSRLKNPYLWFMLDWGFFELAGETMSKLWFESSIPKITGTTLRNSQASKTLDF